MSEGAIDGLSIGFRVEEARPDRARGLRRLQKLDLWEISIVTFPMLPGARVSAVKRERLADAGPLAQQLRRAARRLFSPSPTRMP